MGETMKLELYYDKQQELEQFVRKNIGMTKEEFSSVEMVDKRIFAFKVELAEFSNETGWFKYWKQSHKPNMANVIEELADCIHFLLAIGLYRNYHKFVHELEYDRWLNEDDFYQYNAIMECPINSAGEWKEIFEYLIAIGIRLGFTIEQIELAYLLKNQKNIERQLQKY
jgi:dimeric dUTPase (all-alpha-NTP-PPase superfamily)